MIRKKNRLDHLNRATNRALVPCIAAGAALFTVFFAPRSSEGNPMVLAMKVMMISPAISSDGKFVAMHSTNPASDSDASGSLVVFNARGKEKKRMPLVPPARGMARSKATYEAADALLKKGGYKRMGRLSRSNDKTVLKEKPSDPPPSYQATFTQGDYVFDLKVTVGRIQVVAKRKGRKAGKKVVKFRTPRARCNQVTGYSVSPAKAGYDKSSGLFALSVLVESSGSICFSHELVWRVK